MGDRLVTPAALLNTAILPALRLLPPQMLSDNAAALILMICIQESDLRSRWQIVDVNRPQVKGPARGFPQFEKGTRTSRGGVWGCYLHEASRFWLADLCKVRGIAFTPDEIWLSMEKDDIFAMGVARLMLFTDPKKLPDMGNASACWETYKRIWHPGRPKPDSWPRAHTETLTAILGTRK